MSDAPCGETGNKLVSKYLSQKSSNHIINISPSIHKSSSELTLPEYITARKTVCTHTHLVGCKECDSFINIAQLILKNGFVVLSEAFRNSFPSIKYSAEAARRKLLQMPLVSIVVGNAATGKSLSYLLESCVGTNYQAIQQLLNSYIKNKQQSKTTKAALREILSIAQSDRERELIRYTAFISGNFTQTAARTQLGLESMNRRAVKVESCIKEEKHIRESIEQMAQVEISNLTLG